MVKLFLKKVLGYLGPRRYKKSSLSPFYTVDWKLAGGFAALLVLIVTIGLVGIFQIQALRKKVDELGRYYFPRQKAALEMRISNSLYAMSVRNYLFWHNSKYLETAKDAANREAIVNAREAFDRYLAGYGDLVRTGNEQQRVGTINTLQQEPHDIERRIIDLVDRLDETEIDSKRRKELQNSIYKLMMVFENRLHKIDDFIEGNIQQANLEDVGEQLRLTDLVQKRALTLLCGSLIVALIIGGETAWLVYCDRRREKEKRKELIRRMIGIEEEERKNLSLQVHNQMGQDLSALMIYLDLIEKQLPRTAQDTQEVKERISRSKKILSGLIEKSHNIAELLRPPALEEVGLVDTIAGLIFQCRQMTAIKFIYQRPKAALNLSGEYALILYRVTQEALTNIVKYAQAKNVRIELGLKDKVVRLCIRDDGQGFDYKEFLQKPRRRKEDKLKMGFMGLREKIDLLNGSMRIDTAPGKGTKLFVQLPVNQQPI